MSARLKRLVADPGEPQRVRESAHDYVVGERLQADHAAERLAFYAELMPEAPAAAEPSRLFADLAALEGAEVSERHLMLAHTRYESLLHDGLIALQSGKERGARRGAVA